MASSHDFSNNADHPRPYKKRKLSDRDHGSQHKPMHLRSRGQQASLHHQNQQESGMEYFARKKVRLESATKPTFIRHQRPARRGRESQHKRSNSDCFSQASRKRKRDHDSPPPRPSKTYSVDEKDKSWLEGMQEFSVNEIIETSRLPLDELVGKLSTKIKAFQCTLDNKTILDKALVMDAVVVILSKVADPSTFFDANNSKLCSQILGEVLNRCATFQLCLKMHIKKGSHGIFTKSITEDELSHVCKFFHNLLLVLPESSKFWLPIDDLESVAKQFVNLRDVTNKASLLESIQAILSLRDEAVKHAQQPKKMNSEWWDNSEYKKIDIFPQWHEICVQQKPRLRKNIISGGYTDWLHYYDVQFRLLREDFIAPLRNGVCKYLEGIRGRKLNNVRVYSGVLIKGPLLLDTGICFTVKLDFSHLRRRLNWEHSKRLIYGSLLCLSPENDNFNEKVYFATVVNRNPKRLESEGELDLQFSNDDSMLSYSGKNIPFTMVESCAYFEASQHILRSLQTAEIETMPFSQYLVDGDCSSVSQPKYLAADSGLTYNLRCLIPKDMKDMLEREEPNVLQKKISNFSKCHIQDLKEWPSCDQTELDASQLEGIRMALTQEIAVIQGPPGTGKTYIGLKIVEALQENSRVWNPNRDAKSPILIICFTNHALDQFLEGILDSPFYRKKRIEDVKIVRIGSRSRSERLAEFNLTNKRKNVFLPDQALREIRKAQNDLKFTKEALQNRVRTYFSAKNDHMTLPLRLLEKHDILHPIHHSMLHYYIEICVLEVWLGLITVLDYAGRPTITANEVLYSLSKAVSVNASSMPAVRNNREEEQESSNEESDNESLIDVRGDATIEQSNRIFDDTNPDTLISFSYQEIPDIQQYYSQLLSPESDFPSFRGSYQELEHQLKCLHFDEEKAVKILQFGFSVQPMSEEEALKIRSIHALKYSDRWRLYRYWHSECLKQLLQECEETFHDYNRRCSAKEEAKKKADRFTLETAEIIGMTTTGAAKYQHILHLVKPRIVIVEEAAEVLESHIVSALNAGTQHLILIDDHKQLRPKPNEYELARKYNLDVSLFERLIRNGFPHATLEHQHRMRPEIAQLVKPHIYSVLSNHPSVEDYSDVRGVSSNLFFIKHGFKEKEDENLLSHSNSHEASYLVHLCRYILLQQQFSPQQITILVTYSGQLLAMRKLMPKAEFNGVRICTVDNFQGEENDIILLSLVRSNTEKNVGFLKEENRVCVALSRAKKGFYCIGNFDMLREQVPLWDAIMTDMEQKGKLGDGLLLRCNNHPENSFVAEIAEDFKENSPEGGCQLNCTFRLECGHVCVHKCHFTDPHHTAYQCMKPCTKKCPENHPCPKLCYMECKCEVRVERAMPNCNHKQKMYCHQDPEKLECLSPCKEKCPKGHVCPLLCHEKCKPCEVKVSVTMPTCNHEQKINCSQDPATTPCLASCSQVCANGHKCRKQCYEFCGNCEVEMKKTLPECNHEISLPCYVEPEHSDCTKPCEKTLPCDHKCKLKCGENCSSRPCNYSVTVKQPDCGHHITLACYLSKSNVACRERCEKLLSCGHPCNLLCFEICQAKCSQLVEKVWPCGHKLKRRCYMTQSPDEYPCDKTCMKTLDCGHPCDLLCRENCQTKCFKLVEKEWPCGHKLKRPCYASQSPDKYPCYKNCMKMLECGHPCDLLCFESCQTKCSQLIEKAWPCGHKLKRPCYMTQSPDKYPCDANCMKTLECGHLCDLPCIENCQTKCSQLVEKKWPCGHKLKQPCYETQSPDKYPCNKNCNKKLDCGHLCSKECGQPCVKKCQRIVSKNYPCGHKVEAPCSSTLSDYPCKSPCLQVLACGHVCSGKCSECLALHQHTICPYPIMLKRFCGHSVETLCCGLSDDCCKSNKIAVICSHTTAEKKCFAETLLECDELCEWSCPHFTCTKKCFERCDRPSCNERCTEKLSCGHQCHGLCGEPCLSVCPRPRCQQNLFRERCRDCFSRNSLYYELPCKHIFPVKFLDEYVQQLSDPQSHIPVGPIECPVKKCSQLLGCSYRYGNAVKQQLSYVENVNSIIQTHFLIMRKS